MSSDGSLLASGDGGGSIRLWRIPQVWSLGEMLGAHSVRASGPRSVTAMVMSADAHVLVSGGEDSLIKLWQLPHGKSLGSLPKRREGFIDALAMSADGGLLASASGQFTHVWQL